MASFGLGGLPVGVAGDGQRAVGDGTGRGAGCGAPGRDAARSDELVGVLGLGQRGGVEDVEVWRAGCLGRSFDRAGEGEAAGSVVVQAEDDALDAELVELIK